MKWLKFSTIPIGIFMLVLSLIAPKIEASTTNYNITFYDNLEWNPATQTSSTAWASTNKIEIINNSIIINNDFWTILRFFDVNGNHLGGFYDYQGGDLGSRSEVYIPNNATHFAFNVRKTSGSVWTPNYSFSTFQNLSVSYQSNPTDITTYDNILWNDNQWVDSNGGLTAQSNYYVSYLLDVNALLSYDIIANNNPNFGNLAPNVTHIWYYDSNYALIGSYNAYSDFAANTPNLGLNAYYIRIGAPVTGLGGYEPNEIKSTYISTTNRTLKYLDHTGNLVYQTSEVFVGDSTATYDALAESNLPNREGYVFASWSGLTTVSNDPITTKEAIYNQLIYYVVTFLDYDNTFISSGLVQQGQQAPLPTPPTRQHYVFSHWEPPVADVQGNITTVAQYDLATYQVTWRDGQGNTLKIETVQYSGLATAPEYTPSEGLVVNGWLDNDLPLPQVPLESPIQIDDNKIFVVSLTTAPPINPNLPPEDYSPISDLFGGVIGSSIGAIMTLGTITLFGIQLSAFIYLFISATLLFKVAKAVRG